MAVLASELVEELRGEFVFDVTEAAALRAIDRKHKRMVRRARLRLARVAIGPSVAGLSFYSVDGHGVERIVEVLDVFVDGVPYNRAPRRVQAAYELGRPLAWQPSDEGLFVVTAGSAGTSVGLIPAPDVSGKSIELFTVIEPLTLDQLTDPVIVPDDYTDALVSGAAATFLEREPEQQQLAERLEAKFDNACEELRQQTARLLRGTGPATIQTRYR